MYSQNVYFPDVFKGCTHGCVYCTPSFQRQAKRQKKNCQKCYDFTPHTHFERMKGKTPATKLGEFIFFPKGGDLYFATWQEVEKIIMFTKANPQTTFLLQTKNPRWMLKHSFPSNVILGLTLETDRHIFQTPSDYHAYDQISLAMPPVERTILFASVDHPRKEVTIEPILQHSEKLIGLIRDIKPEFVYVGYDTKKCHLPEPTLLDTMGLIWALEKEGFDVRRKTLRKAWYQTVSSKETEKR